MAEAAPGEVAAPAPAVRPRVRCTYCHDALDDGGPAVHCASCLAPHHDDCHAEHGRCAAPGCDDPRGLIADPAGRPARRATRARAGKAAPWRRVLVGLALVTLALVALAALGWPREAPTPPTSRPRSAPRAEPAPRSEPSPPTRVVLLERVSREVALVARDFRLPVALARGERLVVEADPRGYTHVVLRPADASPSARARARFVAEPGDAVEAVTGPRGARERLRAGPGEAIVLENTDDGQVRVALVR